MAGTKPATVAYRAATSGLSIRIDPQVRAILDLLVINTNKNIKTVIEAAIITYATQQQEVRPQ
jgi:predicted transcriptional regulator